MAERLLIHDHLKRIWFGLETNHGEGPALVPAQGDAIDHISVDAPLPRRRVIPNEEATGNRGARRPLRGAYDPMPIRLMLHLRGGGGTGKTPPPCGPLLKAAGFSEAIGAADVTYTRSLEPSTSAWMWMATRDGSEGRSYTGIAITELPHPDLGTDAAKIEASGQAARGSVVYGTTVGTGAITIAATALPLAPGNGWVHGGAPAWVEVKKADGTGVAEIMKVVAVDQTTNPPRATVVRAQGGSVAAAWAVGDTVRAYVPPRTAHATKPIPETLGGFTVDDGGGAKGRQFVKASLSIKTGMDLLDKEAFADYRLGQAPARYGEDGVRLTADVIYTRGADGMVYLHAHADEGRSLAVVLTVGSQVGNRVTYTMPTAEVVEIAAPDGTDGPRKGTVIFGAYSEDGSDITIKFH